MEGDGMREVYTSPDELSASRHDSPPMHRGASLPPQMNETDEVDGVGHGGIFRNIRNRFAPRSRNCSGQSDSSVSSLPALARLNGSPDRQVPVSPLPCTYEDMAEFLQSLSSKHKKKADLRAALLRTSVGSPSVLDHRVTPGNKTILHVAAELGLTKMAKCLAEIIAKRQATENASTASSRDVTANGSVVNVAQVRTEDSATPSTASTANGDSVDHGGDRPVVKVLGAFDGDGDSALHLAVGGDHGDTVAALLKAGADGELKKDGHGVTPMQRAVIEAKGHALHALLKGGCDWSVMFPLTPNKSTPPTKAGKNNDCRQTNARTGMNLVELACFVLWGELNALDQRWTEETQRPECDVSAVASVFQSEKERALETYHSIISLLLDKFKEGEGGPRMVAEQGNILGRLATFGFGDLVKVVLDAPFRCDPDHANAGETPPLLLAARSNCLSAMRHILDDGREVDVNVRDSEEGHRKWFTPLHHVIDKYNQNHKDDSLAVIKLLLERGADPCQKAKSEESPVHFCTTTNDFAVMATFIDFPDRVGPVQPVQPYPPPPPFVMMQQEVPQQPALQGAASRQFFNFSNRSTMDLHKLFDVEIDGMTLFHFAAGRENAKNIAFLVEKGANLMGIRRSAEGEDEPRGGPVRGERHQIRKLPLQEAIKNSNHNNYFDAVRNLDLSALTEDWNEESLLKFLRSHLIAASRYVRQDIVRLLFAFVDKMAREGIRPFLADKARLHEDILLFRDYGEKTRDEIDEWEKENGSKPEELHTFTKNGLQWAVQNYDRHSVTEFLHREHGCHGDRDDGLRCLKSQLPGGDEILKWAIESFCLLYGMTFFQKRVKPFLCCFPLVFSFFMTVFDISSDVQLTLIYYDKAYNSSSNNNSISNVTSSILSDEPASNISTLNLLAERAVFEEKDYQAAFIMNITCVALPFLVIFYLCAIHLKNLARARFNRYDDEVQKAISFKTAKILWYTTLWLPLSVLATPLYLPFMASTRIVHKFRHMGAKDKNKYRGDLQQSEYLWGLSRTAEAGFESSLQLLLQLWLLSFHLCEVRREGIGTVGSIIDHAIGGFLSFLSVGAKEANENEKNLAKIIVSFISLVITVSSSYKTLKRGSVQHGNLVFIYISNFLQVLARIFSLTLYYTVVHNFFYAVLLPIIVHFFFIVIIKCLCERDPRTESGKFRRLTYAINFFSSTLVNVRIKPLWEDWERYTSTTSSKKDTSKKLKGSSTLDRGTVQNGHAGSRLSSLDGRTRTHAKTKSSITTPHSTFNAQSAFFLLQFLENVALCLAALVAKDSPISDCIYDYTVGFFIVVVVFCVGSWICHYVYYGLWGHPWSDINGPQWHRRCVGKFNNKDKKATAMTPESQTLLPDGRSGCPITGCYCCCGAKSPSAVIQVDSVDAQSLEYIRHAPGNEMGNVDDQSLGNSRTVAVLPTESRVETAV